MASNQLKLTRGMVSKQHYYRIAEFGVKLTKFSKKGLGYNWSYVCARCLMLRKC